MSKRQLALQFLQTLTLAAVAVGSAQAQIPAAPKMRFFSPPVRLPAGEVDIATAAIAAGAKRQAGYVAAVPPQLNAPTVPSAAMPSLPVTAQPFDDLAPPQIETPATGEDSWAPPLPPEKGESVKAEKPRILERIRQRWTRGPATNATSARRANDPADAVPQLQVEVPGGGNPAAFAPPAMPQPMPTAKRGWFTPTQTGSAMRY